MGTKKPTLGLICVVIISIFSCQANIKIKVPEKFKLPVKFTSQLDSINKNLREGQIIFRGGTDIESAIIRDFSYSDKLFSHCGIILKQENRLVVTHILGGSTNPNGNILNQSIEDFFTYPDNESAGIYEVNLSYKELERLYLYVDSIKIQKIVFDLKFNLLDNSKLYCSEFVINALQYAKK